MTRHTVQSRPAASRAAVCLRYQRYAFLRWLCLRARTDFAGYIIDAFDRLWEEGACQPKMLSIGLRIIGRARGSVALAGVTQHMQAKAAPGFRAARISRATGAQRLPRDDVVGRSSGEAQDAL